VENEFSFLKHKSDSIEKQEKYKNKQVLSGEKPCLTACLAAFGTELATFALCV
jgi:hypothetical protein